MHGLRHFATPYNNPIYLFENSNTIHWKPLILSGTRTSCHSALPFVSGNHSLTILHKITKRTHNIWLDICNMPCDRAIYCAFDYSNESGAFQKPCDIRLFGHKKTKQEVDTLYQSPVSGAGDPTATRFARCISSAWPKTSRSACVFGASLIEPPVLVVTDNTKSGTPRKGCPAFGAGDPTRTGTVLRPRDFKSLVSTIPPHRRLPKQFTIRAAACQALPFLSIALNR